MRLYMPYWQKKHYDYYLFYKWFIILLPFLSSMSVYLTKTIDIC
jgi:hypothetical protein